MNTMPQWVSTQLKQENIHHQPVTLKDPAGRTFKGHLEVEKSNDSGQMVVRACYNPSDYAGTVMLTAFRLTQSQMDDFAKDRSACILKLS